MSLFVFADPRQAAPTILLTALGELLASGTLASLEAVFISRPPACGRELRAHRMRRAAQARLGTGRPDASLGALALDPWRTFRRLGVPVHEMPAGDPNVAAVLTTIDAHAGPRHGLSLYCMSRFRAPLLGRFDRMLNFHNGRLPLLRGVRASNWSLYEGEPDSGYCWHEVDLDLDTGGVVLEGEVPVREHDTPADLEVRKARHAAARIRQVVEALSAPRTSTPRSGPSHYYSRRDWLGLCRVEDPGSLTATEWARRLRACLRVETRWRGAWIGVTGLTDQQAAGPAFRCADGRRLVVTSIDFWPATIRLRAAQRLCLPSTRAS